MNSVFGNLGIVGLAVALTVLLLVGIKGGGKVKPLGWWPCLVLGMLAGSSYAAAGGIFRIVPDLVGSLLGAAQGIIPGVTMPAVALTLAIVILFKKLSTQQVAVLGIIFWYAASGAGGVWGTVSQSIANLGQQVS
ncbi:hypothetical protein H1V43_32240 [Streptomyces sp. PSKA54]|uniref:Uncharacterized protein n=1 Tax=Streptomyces himalayensis subsp. aureolus TaxID=2758039 RepID=A0A7W2HJA2_9ACTN|nr:hypothetical protein [Streptomyces himalayensis]MBA4865935.1 hypothetical protein [Streptomyces himalayensis subsp. aureolus]